MIHLRSPIACFRFRLRLQWPWFRPRNAPFAEIWSRALLNAKDESWLRHRLEPYLPDEPQTASPRVAFINDTAARSTDASHE